MKRPQFYFPFSAILFIAGCATNGHPPSARFQSGESVVLMGQMPAGLVFTPSKIAAVRSTYLDHRTNTVHYEAGRDYFVERNQIHRTSESRIPDFKTNILFGKEDFNHGQFPGYGNNPFFVYVDYLHQKRWKPTPAKTEFSANALPKTRKKLQAGKRIRIVAFGDSITAGGEASEPSLIFWERWTDSLRKKYPRAAIETTNGATGGDSTVQGLQRLQEKVLLQKPDLVLIAFGMNDHNREGFGVPLDSFTENLRTMIDRIRKATGAEIILVSAFPPNPKWHFGSHNMEVYANATAAVAVEKRCAFADVYRLWMQFSAKKKPEDLLANNINHPNDFGHWIYFQALNAIGL
jgi:acyl-CoA thioesterase I